ncbi:MAG TPA: 4,5-DOPA dioxygenase extradiol [Chryseolinea sp.]|nr:4,5-DOPA dioxygenase extradiol [Chryseolinea sp.]HPH45897.1 4,5-DOPA dioxygenase extradiol [Chryseolinea sp.]HPM29838.1 4,5-DOPA dioxygenase extradiol [Chryseolinea sp.]
MNREEFIQNTLTGLLAMNSLKDLHSFSDTLKEQEKKSPLLFVGHGSPMNGIEDNEFSQRWAAMGKEIPKPTAVLCISAHWYTSGTFITAMNNPKTIHDFGGFPKALFEVQYPAPGNPELAKETAKLIHSIPVGLDHDWGLDHGTWSVVKNMYPNADIPVLQLSIDYTKPPEFHYALAKELQALRKKGVLIIGSGNMVHNLRIMNWHQPDSGFEWADEMNNTFKKLIETENHQPLIQYQTLGEAGKLSIPTPEHYLPLLYILGMKEKNESISFFNDKTVMGSISMTSVKIVNG